MKKKIENFHNIALDGEFFQNFITYSRTISIQGVLIISELVSPSYSTF